MFLRNMTQKKLESILKQLEEYQKSLDPFDRDKQELMDIIIEQFKEDMPSWKDDNISLEGIFEEIIDQQTEIDSSFSRESHYLVERLLNRINMDK